MNSYEPAVVAHTLALEKAVAKSLAEIHGSTWHASVLSSNSVRLYLYQMLNLNCQNYPGKLMGVTCDSLLDSLSALEELGGIGFNPVSSCENKPPPFSLKTRVINFFAELCCKLLQPVTSAKKRRGFRLYLRTIAGKPVLVHKHADFSRHSDPVENLYKEYRSIFSWTQANEVLRRQLEDSLRAQGVDANIALIIKDTFPTSLLENFAALFDFSDNLRPKTVFTSIYGIMDDPLLAFAIARHAATLYYVQHGGAYCLMSYYAHRIESEGCKAMFYWGLGDNNVYPTNIDPNIKNREISSESGNALLIFSTSAPINFVLQLSTVTATALDQCSVAVCLHPRSPAHIRAALGQHSFPCIIGVTNAQVLDADIVIFDSILHTLIYLRIAGNRPFICLEDPDVTPQFENAHSFLSTLREVGLLLPLEQVRSELLAYKAKPNYRDEFKERLHIARSLIIDNPSLKDLVTHPEPWLSNGEKPHRFM